MGRHRDDVPAFARQQSCSSEHCHHVATIGVADDVPALGDVAGKVVWVLCCGERRGFGEAQQAAQLPEQRLAVDKEQRNEQHDDRSVECARPPLVWVVGSEEASDAQHVEHDCDHPDDDANYGAGTCSDADERGNEGEDHIGEHATDAGDDDRLRKDALSLWALVADRSIFG